MGDDEAYPISPSACWRMAVRAMGAVSARSTRGPRSTATKPAARAAWTSSGVRSPSSRVCPPRSSRARRGRGGGGRGSCRFFPFPLGKPTPPFPPLGKGGPFFEENERAHGFSTSTDAHSSSRPRRRTRRPASSAARARASACS